MYDGGLDPCTSVLQTDTNENITVTQLVCGQKQKYSHGAIIIANLKRVWPGGVLFEI